MSRDPSLPPPMPLTHFEDEAEQNAWILDNWKRWKRPGQPRPCDCGYRPESATRLSLCTEEDRPRCRSTVRARLEQYWRRKREQEVRDKRKWPGPEPFKGAAKGICCWCGDPIMIDAFRMNLRRKRHPDCVTQLLIRLRPDEMRRFIWDRDKGKCAECGKIHSGKNGHWDADHKEPLYFADGDLSFWGPENVVTLCRDPCHKLKSAADMVLIAQHRRAQKSEGDQP